MTDSFIAWHGKMNVYGAGGSQAAPIVVDDNEWAFGNSAGFGNANGGPWHAGNTKFTRTDYLEIANNLGRDSLHNSDGLWIDVSNDHSEVADNTLQDNARFGYFHEISCAVNAHDNLIQRNGSDGIRVSDSNDGDFHHNTIQDNGRYAVQLTYQAHNVTLPSCFTQTEDQWQDSMQNNLVHDNTSLGNFLNPAFTCNVAEPCDGWRGNDFYDNTSS